MRIFLLLITAFAIFAFFGCGNNGEKVYGVLELTDTAVANEEAWMGKEVVVSGYVSNQSPNVDSNGYSLGLDFDLMSDVERQLNCYVPQGKAPEGIHGKWVTVKGKIVDIHSQSYMGLKSVRLEPCEIQN